MTVIENTVKGKTIYFIGKFELGPQYRAEQLGATIVKSMSEDVDWVVAGPGFSSIRLEQTRNLGIEVLDEQQFFELVDPNAWIENERRKARLLEEEKRRTAENEKRRAETERALEIKRATMPHVRAMAYILKENAHDGIARVIHGEEYQNLTADQLRAAIDYGENEPCLVRDQNGDCFLVCINFCPTEQEIELYADGSFDVIELDEDEDEDEEA